MSISKEAVLRIKNRDEGWEDCYFIQLYPLLENRLNQIAQLVDFPDECTRDNFVTEQLSLLHERAFNGKLFAKYDPDRPDKLSPEYWATRFARVRANRYITRSQPAVSYEKVEPEANAVLRGYAPEGQQSAWTIIEKPQLNLPAKINIPAKQAGLQLHPRLDWQDQTLAVLYHHLEKELKPAPHNEERQSQDVFDHLDSRHRVEKTRIQKRRKQLIEKQDKVQEYENWKDGWAELVKLKIEECLWPLTNQSIMDLLGVTEDNAYQRHHRYRKSLPDLLPALGQLHEQYPSK